VTYNGPVAQAAKANVVNRAPSFSMMKYMSICCAGVLAEVSPALVLREPANLYGKSCVLCDESEPGVAADGGKEHARRESLWIPKAYLNVFRTGLE